jgi:prepilin-type N-terminal cleavage/methylation domain-containing protein
MTTSAIRKKDRGGFTLVELLVAMAIIGFMAGMITYALLGAQTDARVAKTRSTIQKLNEVILQQWEEYRYRPVDMRKTSFVSVNANYSTPLPRTQTYLRMLILRDAMRMEMPDRVSDLLYDPSQYVVPQNMPSAQLNSAGQPLSQAGSFLASRAYPHRFGVIYSALYQAIVNSSDTSIASARANFPLVSPLTFVASGGAPLPSPPNVPPAALFTGGIAGLTEWERLIQSSELLYLMVATSNYGGAPALELFRPSDIGDPDEDGLLEFIDAWGKPIRWIRWPAGFPSDLNRYAISDAMDPQRTDWRFANSNFAEEEKPQTIVPLIISAGTDEQFGARFDFLDQSATPFAYALMRQGTGLNQFYIDPFFVFVNGGPNNSSNDVDLKPSAGRANQLGSIVNVDAAADDVTNHDLILEP